MTRPQLLSHLLEEVSRFDPTTPLEEAEMPPAAWYVDPQIHDLEKKAVFSKCWQVVARRDQLQYKASYITGCNAGIPWVVLRDSQNRLRAFFNVCRHKGREVVTGQGRDLNDELTCGYHAWKYHLNGELKSAPGIGGIKNFNPKDMGLTPMAVEEWGHWILVNGDIEAASPEKLWPQLSTYLEQRSWMDFRYHSGKEWRINCNWKIYLDNYLDGGYHIPHMHPSLNSQLEIETYRTECFENTCIQTSGAAKNNMRIGKGSIYAWTYPNFMLNLYGPCLDTNLVIPIDAHSCRVRYEFYFLADIGPLDKLKDDFINSSIEQSDVTQREDIEICESVQVGLSSGAYRPGRYAPALEKGEHHFHRLLEKSYRDWFTNDST